MRNAPEAQPETTVVEGEPTNLEEAKAEEPEPTQNDVSLPQPAETGQDEVTGEHQDPVVDTEQKDAPEVEA